MRTLSKVVLEETARLKLPDLVGQSAAARQNAQKTHNTQQTGGSSTGAADGAGVAAGAGGGVATDAGGGDVPDGSRK